MNNRGLLSRAMTRRSALGLFGAAALGASGALALPGCSRGATRSAQPTRLLVKVPRTGHDVVFDDSINEVSQVITAMARAFEQASPTPVQVEVEVFEQNGYDSAIVNCFDTDRAVDVLYGDYFNMSTYIHTGRVVPLDDVVSPAVRNDIYDLLWNLSTIEDRVYMMPYLSRQNVLAYNKELMRQAGLERFIRDGVIQSWSIQEWGEVLDALAANLPEGTYPMMMYAASSQGDTHIMTLLRSQGLAVLQRRGALLPFAAGGHRGAAEAAGRGGARLVATPCGEFGNRGLLQFVPQRPAGHLHAEQRVGESLRRQRGAGELSRRRGRRRLRHHVRVRFRGVRFRQSRESAAGQGLPVVRLQQLPVAGLFRGHAAGVEGGVAAPRQRHSLLRPVPVQQRPCGGFHRQQPGHPSGA